MKKLFIVMISIMFVTFLSCEKEDNLNINKFAGEWVKPDVNKHNFFYSDGEETSETRIYNIENENLYVKISDSEHSHGLDIVKNIKCGICTSNDEYNDKFKLKYNSLIITTLTTGCLNIKLTKSYIAYIENDTLYENGTYERYLYSNGKFLEGGTFSAKYIKRK